MNEAKYHFERQQLGDLNCGIVRPVDPQLPIDSLAVFCHGYGAGGDDLVGLASEILQIADIPNGTMLVFPEAPLSLEDEGMPGGRAWWKLSIQRLLSAIETGQYELIREEVPDGIDAAREMLTNTIRLACEATKLDASKLLLGGFSQGAMLSVDTAVQGLPAPPKKLCLFSGCLVCERQWKPNATKLNETDIFQSHGRIDPILPIQTGKWLTEMLTSEGCTVDFFEFNGVHTIPMQAIEKTAAMLSELSRA